MNYAETERELQELRRVISSLHADSSGLGSSSSGAVSPSSGSVEKRSKVRPEEIIFHLDEPVVSVSRSEGRLSGSIVDEMMPICSFTLKLETTTAITNVRVCLEASSPITFEPGLLIYPSLAAETETPSTVITATLGNLILPANLRATVIVTYTNAGNNGPRVVRRPFYLPLALLGRLSHSMRETRVTTSLDVIPRDPIDFKQLFADLIGNSSTVSDSLIDGNHVSIGFYFDPSSIVVITNQASNTGGGGAQQRLRLRSDTFQGLSLIGNELIRRLRPLKVTCDPTGSDRTCLPLTEYLALIDRRVSLRARMIGLQSDLASRAGYFRSVQKRLLVKFKDRNPTPLSNLDLLLDEVYSKVQFQFQNS